MNKHISKFCLLIALTCNLPVALAADTIKGQQLYTEYCESCHGSDGRGLMPDTRDFTRGDGLFRSDIEIHASIQTGKNGMPSYQGIISDREIFDIISYLRTFQR